MNKKRIKRKGIKRIKRAEKSGREKGQMYQCKKCGECCRTINSGVLLFGHEVRILKKLAEDMKIELKISPSYALSDEKNRQMIVAAWVIDHYACPFLRDNICSIHAKRPLACRIFPYHEKKILDCWQIKAKSAVEKGRKEEDRGEKDIEEKDMKEEKESYSRFKKISGWIDARIEEMNRKGFIKLGNERYEKMNDALDMMAESGFMAQEKIDISMSRLL